MVTFGTNPRPANIEAATTMDTIGLRTTKAMVLAQAQTVMIANLARTIKTIVITAVATLGGNRRIANAHQATHPQERTLLQKPPTRFTDKALTTLFMDNPSTSPQAPIIPVYQK